MLRQLLVLGFAVLIIGLIIFSTLSCSNQAGAEDPKPQPHIHDVKVDCLVQYGEISYTEVSAFPASCPDGALVKGVSREGGLWKLECQKQSNLCQVCIDGVCLDPTGKPIEDSDSNNQLQQEQILDRI